MPVLKKDLNLTTSQVHYSHLATIAPPIIVRMMIGGYVDIYGPQKSMFVMLVIGAFLPVLPSLPPSLPPSLLFKRNYFPIPFLPPSFPP